MEPLFHELINIKKTKEKAELEIKEREDNLKQEQTKNLQQTSDLQLRQNEAETKINEATKVLTESRNQLAIAETAKLNLSKIYEVQLAVYDELNIKVNYIQSEYSRLSSDISLKENEKVNLSNEVFTLQTDLRGLKKTFASYSNEYASFNKQSNWYIAFYTFVLLIPTCILGFVFYKLFEGSIDLTTIYKKEQHLDVGTIFITRIPFVFISGILIQGSYLIFKLIALKIMDIQSEKLALTKISILAQDIVNLSSEDLKLTDEQISDTNIYLRMEMIKAHLKDTIGKDFEYKVRDSSMFDKLKTNIDSILQPFQRKNSDKSDNEDK
jgi:hypothetical protein